jgi:hypothetical protein
MAHNSEIPTQHQHYPSPSIPTGDLYFPTPAELVSQAMTKVAPDGSVRLYDWEQNDYWTEQPAIIDPTLLTSTQYDLHVDRLTQSITIESQLGFANWPIGADLLLQDLAVQLAPYREAPLVIEAAISRINKQS